MGATITDEEMLVEAVRGILRAYTIFGNVMPKGMSDISLQIIFKLFLAGEKGQSLYVKQLVAESGTSATAALRRIEKLESAGLVRRMQDINDGRRVHVTLTERGRTLVVTMVREAYGLASDEGGAPLSTLSVVNQ